MNKKMLISIALIITMLLNYILPISLAADVTEEEQPGIEVPVEDPTENTEPGEAE